MTQSLAQKRAKDALAKVQALQTSNDYGKYDSYVKALPATIIMNGLGQAMASIMASAKLSGANRSQDHKAYETLYKNISSWLCSNAWESPYRGEGDLLEAITSNNEAAYLRAQAEAMAYLEWLKKFSNAYLGD